MPKRFTDADQLKASEEIVRQKLREIVQLKKSLAEIQNINDTEETIRRTIFGLSEYTPKPPVWLMKKHEPHSPGIPMTIWSDWHFGEQVFKSQVGGANEFNLKIAQARVKLLVDSTLDLCLNHMVKPDYPGIVVCLGGDMITGTIHEELAATNDGTVTDALEAVTDSLIAALAAMADGFGKVFVPCVVGNHGRNSIRPMFKNRPKLSYEWTLYHALERHFKNDDRLQFKIPNATDYNFAVQGHRFTLTHGDTLGVKGGDGIIGVIGPIARGTVKMAGSEAQIGRDFDTLLGGHYHTYIPRSDAIAAIFNGSLIGYNEYARLQLRVKYSRPSQALWFVHPKRGIVPQWPVYLDEPSKTIRKTEWVSWQKE